MDGTTSLRPERLLKPKHTGSLRIGVLSYRSTPTVGGQGVYIDYLSRALVEFGHSVEVISGPPYPHLDPRVGLVEIPSLDLYAQPHNGHLALRWRHLLSSTDTYEYFAHLSGRFVEMLTFGERAQRFVSKHPGRYDVLIDNQCLAPGLQRAWRRLRIPFVGVIHHPITRDRRLALEAEPNWGRRLLIRRWYSFIREQVKVARELPYITCPSQASLRDLVAEFSVKPERLQVIPNGVDRSVFKPDARTRKAPRRLVSTASADVPLKGLPVLVEALDALLPRYPDLELVVIGKLRDGPTKEMLQARGLLNRVTFRSDLTREEMAETFRSAAIAVTPSLYEGFGLPAAEAMMCGTAVVVTDGGSLPEVAGDAGIVVPRGDPRALADGIAALLDDPAQLEHVGNACRARAEELFDWSRIAPRFDALLRSAIAAPCY
jgi:glycosyltransferase involved in cell wall biosynthesis